MMLVDKVYAVITGQTLDDSFELGSEPGKQPGSMRALPLVPISQISGLVEQVANENGRVDVYQLARDVTLPTDELLPIVEAVELLSFGTLDSGDLTLTPLGKEFAEADIQRRKEIFADQVHRIPVVKWMEQMLTASKKQRVDRDVFMTALELDFNATDAYSQLETAIDWGRYAELFSFDDDSDQVFLGTELEDDPEKEDPQLHSID
jgi:NitT/TauT family transport system ATP-binding protein